MPIQFSNPLWLLLLPAIFAYFWWCDRHTITDMSPARRRYALALRCVVALLLIFVLAGFKLVRKGDSLAVVFVVDSSRSVRDDQQERIAKYIRDASQGMHTVDKVGVITFASDAHLQSPIGQSLDTTHLRDPGVTTATDIGKALQQAQNVLKTAAKDSGKRIVLLSDGNENIGTANGGALGMVRELAADGIVLDTITLPINLQKEALIEKMVLPNRVKIGEPFVARVVVSSKTAQTASITMFKEGKPTGQARQVELHPGKNVVSFDQQIDAKGFFRYSATLTAPDDTIPENNRGEGFVWVDGKPTVLYVADSPALTEFLRKSVRALNINIEYMSPQAMPTSAAGLQPYDSVFLSNVPASALSDAQMTALQVACRDFGIGVGMVGGDTSFGAGGYRGTPLEETLPVSMDVKKQKRLPSVAVALVIEDLEIQSTVNMSIEAAKATMDLLEPIDQVGVLDCQIGGFGGGGGIDIAASGSWRIPMQHVTDREAIKVATQNLQNMGDPPSYDPFLLEAARVLNQTDAKIKHIVFFGDGDSYMEASQGQMAADIKSIRDSGITLSTITTGANNADCVRFMAAMAAVGGGQAYEAERPQDLPRLLLKDQETISQPPIVEEPFRAVPVETDEILKGIDWSGAPPLLGYNITSLKPSASLSLRNSNPNREMDPVFAGWRYGLGRSVAFMSDDRAHWAAPWLGWSGYGRFWAQAIRWTLRPFAPSEFSTQVAMEGNRGHIVVDAIDSKGHYVNRLGISARVVPPGVGGIKAPTPTEQTLRQTSPGHYEGWFDAPQTGTYLINVLQKSTMPGQPDRATSLGLSTAYSPEYRDTQPNTYLMTQLSQAGNGRAEPTPASVFGVDRPIKWAPTDMIPFLLALTLPLLLFDIATRRLALDRKDFARFLAWMRVRTRAKVPQGGATTPELSRLMQGKERAAASMQGGTQTQVPDTLETQASGAESVIPVATSSTAPSQAASASTSIPRKTAATLRPDDYVEPPPPPAVVEVPASAPEPPAEEQGLSRLMAAKRRAQQRQQEKDER